MWTTNVLSINEILTKVTEPSCQLVVLSTNNNCYGLTGTMSHATLDQIEVRYAP